MMLSEEKFKSAIENLGLFIAAYVPEDKMDEPMLLLENITDSHESLRSENQELRAENERLREVAELADCLENGWFLRGKGYPPHSSRFKLVRFRRQATQIIGEIERAEGEYAPLEQRNATSAEGWMWERLEMLRDKIAALKENTDADEKPEKGKVGDAE